MILTGSPLALLSVIGRNMVGRIQVAAPGATLSEPPRPIEVADLLQGDNSEEAFAELVRQHATRLPLAGPARPSLLRRFDLMETP